MCSERELGISQMKSMKKALEEGQRYRLALKDSTSTSSCWWPEAVRALWAWSLAWRCGGGGGELGLQEAVSLIKVSGLLQKSLWWWLRRWIGREWHGLFRMPRVEKTIRWFSWKSFLPFLSNQIPSTFPSLLHHTLLVSCLCPPQYLTFIILN